MKSKLTINDKSIDGIVVNAPIGGNPVVKDVPGNSDIWIDFLTNPGPVKLGDSVPFEIILISKKNVLTVPKRALSKYGNSTVRILNGTIPDDVNVQVGIQNDFDVEILSGLEEGQKVILN